jgi:hypothetical protein
MRTQPTGLGGPATRTFQGSVQQFIDPAKFIAQLRNDRTEVRHGLVRTTKEQISPGIGRYEEMHVLAGYLVNIGAGGLRRVELDYPCGVLWGVDRDREALDTAAATLSTLSAAIRRCGLAARSGRLVVKQAPSKPRRPR